MASIGMGEQVPNRIGNGRTMGVDDQGGILSPMPGNVQVGNLFTGQCFNKLVGAVLVVHAVHVNIIYIQ